MVKAAKEARTREARTSEARTTVDPAEVARFARLADEWWNPHGKMRPLHKFNPVRLAYIRDRICERFGRDAKSLESLKGLRILDVGCGGGLVCEPMARLGASVVGIDPGEPNVAAARLHAEKSGLAIDYRATTAEALADTGERFDVVLALEVVEHVADVTLFVRRCAEMVKPGGLMIVATLNRTLKSFRAGDRRRRVCAALAAGGHASLGKIRDPRRTRDGASRRRARADRRDRRRL